MHMLMSFVGCVGTLMADTELKEVMESAFGGVTKLLSGKNFPQNVRGLRLVVEELLRSISGRVRAKMKCSVFWKREQGSVEQLNSGSTALSNLFLL